MRIPGPLPVELGRAFTAADALRAGVNDNRLRRADLERPFHGIRARRRAASTDGQDAFERQAAQRRVRARSYGPRLRADQFLSHDTAVALFGGPLPLVIDGRRDPVNGADLPVHVSTLGAGPVVRTAGVAGHRADPRVAEYASYGGLQVATPATAWAQLGILGLPDLVALGDYFCRVWRPGPGRPHAGRSPLATVDELRAQLRFGGRPGIRRLREAADLIREDSWSPRESMLRVLIVRAGIPEPMLNHDVFDDHGRFLGCVDLAYPELRIAIEYHGTVHAGSYARDVERMAALRAAGWTVIEVTADLFQHPEVLISRVRAALAG